MSQPATTVAKPLIVLALLLFLVGLHYQSFKSTAGMDFEHYYVGAKMVAAGQGSQLHDANAQFQWQAKILNGVSTPFNYPAPMALLYWPVTLSSMNGGYLIWSFMSTLMFVASVLLLNRAFGFVRDPWFLVLICAAYLPVQATLATGQCDAFLLLSYSVSLVLLKEGKNGASGLALSLALLKFHLVLPFALVMLFRRQWRFLLGFASGGVALLAVWLWISGPGLFTQYPQLVMGIKDLPRGRFEPALMANFRGVFDAITRHEAPLWLIAVVALVGLAYVANRWSDVETGFSAAMTMMILTSYHGYVYDLILLLIPLMVATKAAKALRTPFCLVLGSLAIPIIPYLLVRTKMVWLLTIPVGILCWLLVSERTRGGSRSTIENLENPKLTTA
jgi:hypothetical protein